MSKLRTLAEAAALVQPGDTLAIGGFGLSGHPMALLRELVRQRIGGLTVLGFTSGLDVDLLAGAGLVARVESSAVSLEGLGLAPNFRRAVERHELMVREYSESMMFHRFWAGANGLTFMPTRVPLGTDIARVNPELVAMDCPLTGDPYYAMPPARPACALLHVPIADERGNAAFPGGGNFAEVDRLMAWSADRVIVTCERLAGPGELSAPGGNVFTPAFKVAAVVELPRGSHPSGLGDLSENDEGHLARYAAAARTPESFSAYLERYVFGCTAHEEYLALVDGEAG